MSDKYSIESDRIHGTLINLELVSDVLVCLTMVETVADGPEETQALLSRAAAYELGRELIRMAGTDGQPCAEGPCMTLVPLSEYRERGGRCDAHRRQGDD